MSVIKHIKSDQLINDYSFGIAATLLEMIPFANLIFAFTNTVGAALWAADIERQGTTSTTAPNLREQAKKAE
jgi:hypothetical protein